MVTEDTTITLPRIRWMPDEYVTRDSPFLVRKAVFKLARFCRREREWDFTLFDVNDSKDYKVAVFKRQVPDRRRGDYCMELFGAACFRFREAREQMPAHWAMQWVWFHPYFRGHGKLKDAWPSFLKDFGDFFPETPYSSAMAGFLRKHASPGQRALFLSLGDEWRDWLEGKS